MKPGKSKTVPIFYCDYRAISFCRSLSNGLLCVCCCCREAIVVLKAEDVSLLVAEFELPKEAAENLLRSHKGNVEAALRAYIGGN